MLRKEQRPKVSRTKCWGRYSNLGEAKQQTTDKNYIMRNFIICTLHIILFVSKNQEGWEACSIQGAKWNTHKSWDEKPQRKRPLGFQR